MAKHDFESDTMTVHDIMSCTRVFRVGDRFDRVRITSSRAGSFGFQDYWFSKVRPTGAHRHDEVPIDVAVYVTPHVIECPRGWNFAEPFEFIDIPSV